MPTVVWVGALLTLVAGGAIAAAVLSTAEPPSPPAAAPAVPTPKAAPAVDRCAAVAAEEQGTLTKIVRAAAKGAPLATARAAISGLAPERQQRAEVVALSVFLTLLDAKPGAAPSPAVAGQVEALVEACPRTAAPKLAEAWLLTLQPEGQAGASKAAAATAAGLPGFRADLSLNLALMAFQAKRFDLAAVTAHAVVAHRPDDLDARYVAGQAALFSGDPKAAVAAFRAIVHKDPERGPVWWALSEARSALGDGAGAQQAACTAKEHGVASPEAAARCAERR